MQAVSARSYSRNSGRTCALSVTGKPGYRRSTTAPIRSSCAGFTYELTSATVSVSTPDSTRSRTIPSTCCSSTATSVLPRASMRSTASRVSASEAGGSGLIMMIQPASGPGVWERARCRICLKPCVVIRPTRAPLDSSTAFVATVVPWTTLPRSAGAIPAASQIRLTPVSTPCEGSEGVEGVFTRHWRWSESSTRNRSVNVPPTSTPSRYANAVPFLDDAFVREALARLRVHSELLQHCVRIGAHGPAGGLADRTGRPAQLGDHPRHGDLPVDLIRERHEQLALAEMRVLVDVLGGVDRGADDAALVDELVELLGRVLRREGADDLVQQVLVLAARVVGGEALVLPQLR